MRVPPFFTVWCFVVLAVFALAKQFGFDAWPFAAGAYASASAGGSGDGGGGGSSSSGGHSSGSSSHK